MGLFKDIVEGFTNGVVSAAADGRVVGAGHGTQVIQTCCSQLGWGIDERVGSSGFVLHFKDPLVGIRKLLITVGESGRIIVLLVSSAGHFSPQQLSSEVLGYLLRRNSELVFGAWRLAADTTTTFDLTYGLLASGLDAAVFKALCESMCKEVYDFDAKLRQAGLL
jgi:hypothetical protein